ncbi:reverse transcriptase domain-containing protein [Tanacetum coccineum]
MLPSNKRSQVPRSQEWTIELGKHYIEFGGRGSRKTQIPKDFSIEMPPKEGAGLMLISPEGREYTYALRFEFETTNNEAEYEALLAGLRIT